MHGDLTRLSLVGGWLHAVLVVGALGGLAALVLFRRDRSWLTRRVPLAVVVTTVLGAALLVAAERLKSWPDGFPRAVLVWTWTALLGLVLLALGWARQRWWVRGVATGAALLLLLGAADGVDAEYGAFPTVGTALQLPSTDVVPAGQLLDPPGSMAAAGPLWQTWRPPAHLPTHGAITQVSIPATASGFRPRDAWVYVPPAFLTPRPPLLPVLMLLGGQPGSPRDWVDAGRLPEHMDAWAAAHSGLAPIVVMPDATGGELANPLCMDSALGRADTYLARDVPAWVSRSVRADLVRADWAVGGFSYGGTCALQLAVAHPALFRTFLDVSGQQAPTLGSPARTLAATFGGNAAEFAAVDPLTELRGHRYPGSAGFFAVGAEDPAFGRQQRVVVAAAGAAGLTVVARELPGRHNWAIGSAALAAALPWLAARMGLAP